MMDTDYYLPILKALSDNTRLKIIDLLLQHDYCVGALAFHMGMTEAAISQHLKVLRKAGIVTGEKRGYYTHYNIDKGLIARAGRFLVDISSSAYKRQSCKFEATGDHSKCRVYSNQNKK